MAGNRSAEREPDVIAELKRLGRQLGQTLDAAWKSAERQKAEEDLRAGARAFASEFERAFSRARTARPSDMASRTRRSMVEGLRWMSAELESLADRFTPGAEAEEPPEEGERR
jgi:hypothetical protein